MEKSWGYPGGSGVDRRRRISRLDRSGFLQWWCRWWWCSLVSLRVGPLGSSGPPWRGTRMAMEGVSSWMEISPLVHLSPESGSSGVLVLLCWCVSLEQASGWICPPPVPVVTPWAPEGSVGSSGGWWSFRTAPPGLLSWMNRCVTQFIPGCGSALGLWIPGLAGWVLLCCCCGPPPHRRWAVGLLA